MWYLLFIYLGILIIAITITEIYLRKTKEYIRYNPIFGRALYFCSLFSWMAALLTYTLSNQSFWLGIAILVPLSFFFFLLSLLLLFTHYEINKDSLVKSVLLIKKEYQYEDFAISYSAGRIVATSRKTGKELFAFTSFHTNVEALLEAYANSVQTRKINLESKVVKANKITAYFGLWTGFLGLAILALAVVSTIPSLFELPVPLYATIVFWILSILVLSFSLYCWLNYLFHYLVIDNGNILIHKPFHIKKTFDHRNLHIKDNSYMIILNDNNGRPIFVFFKNFTENFTVLYKYLDEN